MLKSDFLGSKLLFIFISPYFPGIETSVPVYIYDSWPKHVTGSETWLGFYLLSKIQGPAGGFGVSIGKKLWDGHYPKAQ